MKWHDVAQNTPAWYDARAGLATTSAFEKILTPGGVESKQADGYANMIIAELMLNKTIERNFNIYSLEWGIEHEAEACNLYSFETNCDVAHGGFYTNDEMTWGSSPDVRVMKDGEQVGIAEIKCPENPANHVEFLRRKEINPKHKPQVQGQLLLSECDWCDWFSYYPGMPSNRIRVFRDDEYIGKLKSALEAFDELIREEMLKFEAEIPEKKIRTRKESEPKDQLEGFMG